MTKVLKGSNSSRMGNSRFITHTQDIIGDITTLTSERSSQKLKNPIPTLDLLTDLSFLKAISEMRVMIMIIYHIYTILWYIN